MPEQSKVWEQMAKDVRMVMSAVGAGLHWERTVPPNPQSTALMATGPLHTAGPKFNLTVVHWVEGQRSGYDGFVMVFAPSVSVIHVPADAAKLIYEKALNSLN